MVACPACPTENPDGARFCMGCGSALAAQARARSEERRTISVLFADLAGFTSRSETLDPEDVRAFLVPYYDVLNSEVTRHGGYVDRFLGDGIMALFGAPVAHEDDPERAVRAALRILERVPALGLDLHARIGINTGPVLFTAAAGQHDDSVTGDTVNTAARLQALAPVDGVVVGEGTYAATRSVFDYVALEPVPVKGRTEPVATYRATAPRARLGIDLTRGHGTPHVGREADLALLRALFDKGVAEGVVQLVTIVGEPGIGKSRIVGELLAHAQLHAPALTWRQGRCLPYGDGITFWALGEIVKAQAGILDTDDPATAIAKIDDAVPAGPDRDWLRQRLLPLVGVGASPPAERGELFAAWRTFLETIAEQTPTVLVFEDVQWADDAMLAFIEHLADRAQCVPLLLVATARPELFERHKTFAAGLPNVNQVNLARLTDAETAQLVGGLLGAVVSAGLLAPIQERAEGNPLYAGEFVRLLRDRDLLVEVGGTVALKPGTELPLPESIGALIAARLDTLPPERKAMLSDAAVVGKVFWAGAVAAMGGRDVAEVTEALHELARKELVRPARRSSMAGEVEYSFWHLLTRDVGYAALPRASRSARHVAAAAWLEGKAGGRVEDIAEVLAHHYATALELARAAGQSERAAELEEPALRYLTLAGEKAMRLDIATAVATLQRALDLAPTGHAGRARLLRLLGAAERANTNIAAALAHMQEAVVIWTASGDRDAADETDLGLQKLLHAAGDRRAGSGIDTIIERLEQEGPSELLADAYSTKQFYDTTQPWADRALAIAEQLDLPAVRQDALNMRGLARANRGDPGGIDDLRTSLGLALGQLRTRPAQAAYINLAWSLVPHDLVAALELADAGVAFDRSRGTQSSHIAAIRQWALLGLGRWDELLEAGEALVTSATPLGDRWTVRYAAAPMAIVLSRRGMAREALDIRRASSDDAYETRGLFALALVAPRMLGEMAEAERMLADAVVTWEHGDDGFYGCEVAREAVTLHRLDVLERLISLPERSMVSASHARTTWRAIAAESRGHPGDALDLYQIAAGGWRSFGDPYEFAHALLGAGRCQIALGRSRAAVPHLDEARDIFERLGAAPALAETNALLATAT